MFISSPTIDDILHRVFEVLLRRGRNISPGKGPAVELIGVLIELRNPRARLSRTETRSLLFGCLGELLWYLAGSDSDKFIRYYLPEYPVTPNSKGRILSAYGPRLIDRVHDVNQINNAIQLLRNYPDSRRAVIQIFDAKDTGQHYPEVPCTCTLQFFLRRNRVHMLVNMRSNDAFVGLPADIFAFTMIQEIIARSVGAEMGSYRHCVGSLHLYDRNRAKAERYLAERWQSTLGTAMPPMPFGDPWPNVQRVLAAERRIRNGSLISSPKTITDAYWLDLIHLLRIYQRSEAGDHKAVTQLRKLMSTRVFDVYIDNRRRKALKVAASRSEPIQRELFEPL